MLRLLTNFLSHLHRIIRLRLHANESLLELEDWDQRGFHVLRHDSKSLGVVPQIVKEFGMAASIAENESIYAP